MFVGFSGACLRRTPRLDDPQLLQFVKQWQRRKLKKILASLFSRSLDI